MKLNYINEIIKMKKHLAFILIDSCIQLIYDYNVGKRLNNIVEPLQSGKKRYLKKPKVDICGGTMRNDGFFSLFLNK